MSTVLMVLMVIAVGGVLYYGFNQLTTIEE